MVEVVFSSITGAILQDSDIYDKSNRICVADMMLDVGYVDCPMNSRYRYDIYNRVYWHEEISLKKLKLDMGSYYEVMLKAIARLKAMSDRGEPVRIWRDIDDGGTCGFYYICSVLSEANTISDVSVVEFPQNYKTRKGVTCYRWDSLTEKGYERMAKRQERSLSPSDVRRYGDEWKNLSLEKYSLRTLVDGMLRNVSEDFYDGGILDCIIGGEMPENDVAEKFLRSHRNVSPYVPLWRIHRMMRDGTIIKTGQDECGAAIIKCNR